VPVARSVGARLAVGLRTSGFTLRHQPVRGLGTERLIAPARWLHSQLLGVGVSYRTADDLLLGAALGPHFFATRPLSINLDRGVGLSLRLGRPFWRGQSSVLAATWELGSAAYRNFEVVISSTLLLEWQRW
jgi:hypothetical protein